MMRERAEAVGAQLTVTSQPVTALNLSCAGERPTEGDLMTIPPSKPIRVMVVDDHTMVRRGLATFLKVFDDLQLAGRSRKR